MSRAEGFVFLGQRIARRPKGPKRYVYTLVCDEALASVKRKVKTLSPDAPRPTWSCLSCYAR